MSWQINIKEWEKLNTLLVGWMGYSRYLGLKSNAPRLANKGRGYGSKDCWEMVEGEIGRSRNPVLVKKLLRGYVTLGEFQKDFISSEDMRVRDAACSHLVKIYNATEGV